AHLRGAARHLGGRLVQAIGHVAVGELVAEGSQVARDAEAQAVGQRVLVAQQEFPAFILDRCAVHELVAALAHHAQVGQVHQNVGAVLNEVVDRAGELVAEEAKIGSYVGLGGSFPLQVGVGLLHAAVARGQVGIVAVDVVGRADVVGEVGVERAQTRLVNGARSVVGNVLVARLAPAGAQLQVRHESRVVLQKILLADAPAARHGRKDTELVVSTKPR
nr:hypothetical protein [Tanacetum cinerariifolium]